MTTPLYSGLLFLAAATLAFEVTLTRLFALAQGHHFAFMAVSLALLGAGASGTFLSLKYPVASSRYQVASSRLPCAEEETETWNKLHRWLTISTLLFTLTAPASYLLVNHLPFDAYRIAWEPLQLLWLTLYYLALTTPFFFSGLAIGAALIALPRQVNHLYAINLLGSGLGPPLGLVLLATVGGPATIFAVTGLGALAFLILGTGKRLPAALDRLTFDPRNSHRDTESTKDFKVRGSPAGADRQPARRPAQVDPRNLPQKNTESHGNQEDGHGSPTGPDRRRAGPPAEAVHRPAGVLLLALCLLFTVHPPAWADIRLTPYHSLPQALLYPGSRVITQTWNAFSRVDVIESPGIRSAPGLSLAYTGRLPMQKGMTTDGQNLTPILAIPPAEAGFTTYLPASLAYQLRPKANVLIIEPGGGLAVLTARHAGAHPVTVVQSNPAIVAAVEKGGGDLYHSPQVNVVVDEARSYLRRQNTHFDLIVLPLTDSFRPVTAGAYALGEEYRYTVEAFTELWQHLSPQGLLVTERWLQLPPTESLRLWGITLETARRAGLAAPGNHLIALRTFQTSLILLAKEPFTPDDLRRVREFATSRQFDLIWTPDLPQLAGGNISPAQADSETLRNLGVNRYNRVTGDPYFQTFIGLLTAPDPARFYRDYAYAIAPPTDDRPFFFHFFKWQQTPAILASLGKTWQPFGGSGYLILVLLLALVLLLSITLILLPLALRPAMRHSSPTIRHSPLVTRHFLYFSLLGLGFLFVEISLLQRFILYLGQPAYAFAVVVASLLVTSGIGSRYLVGRLPLRWGLALLIGLIALYPMLLPPLFHLTFALPFAGRALLTFLALLPLGLLMGVPFPQGLALAQQQSPGLIPWIWAVNGCASVVSAVLAPMIAIDLGFRWVMGIGAVAYLGALFSRPGVTSTGSVGQRPHPPS